MPYRHRRESATACADGLSGLFTITPFLSLLSSGCLLVGIFFELLVSKRQVHLLKNPALPAQSPDYGTGVVVEWL